MVTSFQARYGDNLEDEAVDTDDADLVARARAPCSSATCQRSPFTRAQPSVPVAAIMGTCVPSIARCAGARRQPAGAHRKRAAAPQNTARDHREPRDQAQRHLEPRHVLLANQHHSAEDESDHATRAKDAKARREALGDHQRHAEAR